MNMRLGALATPAMARTVILLALGGIVVSACATEMLRAREESHCRAALDKLGEWTGEKDDASIDRTVASDRTVDGKQVRIVTITYQQGGTGRLITCTYAASGKGPVLDVIYKNVHLTDDDLKRLNAAVK